MPDKGKKKAKDVEEESNLEIMPRIEIIYEDTKAVTGAKLEFKWGQIYPQGLDAGLEDISLYENIRILAIT